MQAKFHREVGDGSVGKLGMSPIRPGTHFRQVVVEFGEYTVVQGQVSIVLRDFIQSRTFNLTQKQDRVMGQVFPQVIVNTRKQTLRVGLPGPPKVVSQFAQTVDAPWQIKMVRDASMKIGHSGTIIPPI